jgi:hypothetical protein
MPQTEIILHKPHKGQLDVLKSDARFKVIMCGRRWGKSLISKDIAIQRMLEGKKVAYITPTYGLAKVFFDELCILLPTNIFKTNRSDLTISFLNGGVMRFFTGEKLDNLRGLNFHLSIIDEASFIPDLENGWNNSIRPTLTDFKGDAIFLSTPRGKNYFYSLYLRSGEQGWQSFKYTTYDNPHIDPSEIDQAKSMLPYAVFQQEYMANPAENAANPFGYDNIDKCIAPLTENKPEIFGIDLAKTVDWTVIIGLDKDGKTCYVDRFQADWGTTKMKIKALPNVQKVIDSTGVGDSVVEDLQRDNVYCYPYKFTSTSKQELMRGLQISLHQGSVSFPSGVIEEELKIIEYQYSSHGVKYSAPQGFHDDCVMSLALAIYGYNKFKPNTPLYYVH